jgi:hypothetical protein
MFRTALLCSALAATVAVPAAPVSASEVCVQVIVTTSVTNASPGPCFDADPPGLCAGGSPGVGAESVFVRVCVQP